MREVSYETHGRTSRSSHPNPAMLGLGIALSVLSVFSHGFVAEVAAQSGSGEQTAAEEAPLPPDAARRFFERGTEHYRAGRYREAADDLERALLLDPVSPTLAYNLGRVYELLGEIDSAIQHYDRYVQLVEDPDEQQRMVRTIERLRGAAALQAEQDELEGEPADSPTTFGPAWLPWSVVGTGIALVASGGSLGALALVRDGQTRDFVVGLDGTYPEREAFAEQTRRLALAADLLIGTGGALAVGGLIWLLLRPEVAEEDRVELSLVPRVNGASLELRGAL